MRHLLTVACLSSIPVAAPVAASHGAPAISLLWTAEPPTDEQIDRAIATYRQVFASGGGASHDAVVEASARAMEGIDVSSTTGVQLARLMENGSLLRESRRLDQAKERLRTFLPDRGPDGAAAAVCLLAERLAAAGDEPAKLAILRETMAHPGLEAAARAGGANTLFGALAAEAAPVAPSLWAEITSLQRLLTPELAPKLAPSFTDYYDLVKRAAGKDEQRAKDLEPIRAKLVQLARGSLDRLDERTREFVTNSADYLDGAFVKGQLVDKPAPALDVLWSSDPAIKSLEGLKGRVVVLDFWATWCGPCVESLPKVGELQERYRDYPVTILGVTSLQGSVVLGGKMVPCKGDPAREIELMSQYIGEHRITWPIVLTRQSVTNPEYGIRGIPHVVIIDPAGVVRYRGLHPAQPLAAKAEKIDALLKEFSLKTPPPPASPKDPEAVR